jgi:hypothetical protein
LRPRQLQTADVADGKRALIRFAFECTTNRAIDRIVAYGDEVGVLRRGDRHAAGESTDIDVAGTGVYQLKRRRTNRVGIAKSDRYSVQHVADFHC